MFNKSLPLPSPVERIPVWQVNGSEIRLIKPLGMYKSKGDGGNIGQLDTLGFDLETLRETTQEILSKTHGTTFQAINWLFWISES